MKNKINGFADMIGLAWLYMGRQYLIKDIVWNEDVSAFEVETDVRTLKVTAEQLKKDFQQVEGPAAAPSIALVRAANQQGEQMNSLAKVLMDEIDKLKNSTPEEIDAAIKRAQAINETAKTVIDLGRAQTEAFVQLLK